MSFESKYYDWVECAECGDKVLGYSARKKTICESCRIQGSKPIGATPTVPQSHIDYHGEGSSDDV